LRACVEYVLMTLSFGRPVCPIFDKIE